MIKTTFFVIIILFCLFAWPVNLYRLTQCDFESPYRCEVLHGVGLVPFIAPFVVLTDVDELGVNNGK